MCTQVGVIGLVESEWLVTLATIEPDDVIYTDYVEAARELVPELQSEVWCRPSFSQISVLISLSLSLSLSPNSLHIDRVVT